MKNIFKKILLLNKKEGETPLEALENFRRKKSKKNKKYKDVKMTYAGRLDPMASGLLLVLAGGETKNKEKYLALEKEYEFSVLFGFATDTYDILGRAQYSNILKNIRTIRSKSELEKKIKENLKSFVGKFKQKYPMYSSKTVHGKPLFTYARAGKAVESPEHEVNVKSLKFLKISKINNTKLLANIEKRIKKVKGDFRQKEILKIWRRYLKANQIKNSSAFLHATRGPFRVQNSLSDLPVFFIADFYIKCGSGTYVRSIANDLGRKIKIPALALSIKRTKIGKWRQVE